jgi:putative FmdB family regulatory protein
MPLYEFRCSQCDRITELLVRLRDAAPPCPQCGGAMHKLISGFAVATAGTKAAALSRQRVINTAKEKDRAIALKEYVERHDDH